jgi:hypothetical protein
MATTHYGPAEFLPAGGVPRVPQSIDVFLPTELLQMSYRPRSTFTVCLATQPVLNRGILFFVGSIRFGTVWRMRIVGDLSSDTSIAFFDSELRIAQFANGIHESDHFGGILFEGIPGDFVAMFEEDVHV